MHDFDANDELARLPADAGVGGARAEPRPGGLAVASPAAPSVAFETPAPRTGAGRGRAAAPGADGRLTAALRYLDVAVVAVAAIPAIALGAPALGYAIGALAWIGQRILQHADRSWISNAAEPRTQLGLNLFEAFGRIWLLAGAIILAGVAGGRADGLTAAITIFGAYSVAFAVKVLCGPPPRKSPR